MRFRDNRWMTSIVAVVLASSSVLAACSNDKAAEPTKSDGGDPYDKMPKEISINVRDYGTIQSDEGNVQDNRWTKWINENSGVKVNWIATPPVLTDSIQKLNTLFAAGEGPSLVQESNRQFLGNLVTNGTLQPIDEYVEKYSVAYKKYLNEHPELREWVTFDDGKMYLTGTMRTGWSQVVHGAYIRQDWLDKLGLKMPTTMDELLETARAFKTKDPDGNGKEDTVGFAIDIPLSSGPFYTAFQSGTGNYWYVENGKPKFGLTISDRMKAAIDANRTLYQDGLIDKEYLTDKNFERSKQLFLTGKAGILMGTAIGINSMYRDFAKNNPNGKIVPLPAVSTKVAKNGYNQAVGLASTMVGFNKSLKNPKAAMQFLDWMMTTGSNTVLNGIEGTHYKLVDNVRVPIDSKKNERELNWTQPSISFGGIMAVDNGKFEDILKNPNPDPVAAQIDKIRVDAAKTFLSIKFRRDLPVLPSFNELNQITTSYSAFVEQAIAKAVIGGTSYTADHAVADIEKEWIRLGGDKVDEMMKAWYDKRQANVKK